MNAVLPCVCNIDNIATVKQSTYYHCAAACIKMCTGLDLSQEDVYKVLHEQTVDKDTWYAEPDSVFNFLKEYMPIARTSQEAIDSKTATEKIISSFLFRKLSAPMLVMGGKHWVLYSGYQMDERGELKGIYIRDPWPTSAPLTFYPFSPYYFDEYFCKINVSGNMEGRVESFVSENIDNKISIRVIDKPQNGGSFATKDILFFKNDIIQEDLQNFGFNGIRFIKNGGALLPDCIVKGSQNEDKYVLSFLEINDQLTMVAIDVKRTMVIGVSTIDFTHSRWYNKKEIAREYQNLYGDSVDEESISYIYDQNFCKSCLEPIISINGKKYSVDLKYQLSDIEISGNLVH